MEKSELIAKINQTLAEEFEVEESVITPEANIKQTLSLSSLDVVDLIAVIEFDFGVKIPMDDYLQMQTFQTLYDYLEQRVK